LEEIYKNKSDLKHEYDKKYNYIICKVLNKNFNLNENNQKEFLNIKLLLYDFQIYDIYFIPI
jgi:hypothetical protein